MPDYKEIDSSLIAAVAHEQDTLYVQFHQGRRYAFDGVPEHVFEHLINSKSPGNFFHSYVKKYFSGQEVTDEE
jgi:hypothetical protein